MRVLVVDDDARSRELLGLVLDSAGHTAATAATVAEAWASLRSSAPDLLLTDLRIESGTDGLELMAGIRADPRLAGLPIIALTGVTGSSDLARARTAGAQLCLAKPVDVRRLLGELARLAGEQGGEGGQDGRNLHGLSEDRVDR